ncbi:MAG TPA: hypothetical protein VM580_14125 [Labilithrix sp.]|nr:hypothetical protein [Labilithrix sp.]
MSVGFPVLVVLLCACAQKETVGKDGTVEDAVTFSPACGKAGDEITIRAKPLRDQEGCVRSGKSATFHPGVVSDSQAGMFSSPDTCTFTVHVPEAARTGTLEVDMDSQGAQRGTLVSKDVFTIPCPPDSGPGVDPDASTPDSSVPAGPPLNAVFIHRRFSNSPQVNTEGYTFAKLLDDAQKAAVARREAIVRSELSPPGIAVGTCAPLALPAEGADLPKPIYRGPLALKAGPSTVFDGLQCGPDFVYRKPYQHSSFTGATIWELAWGGDGSEEGLTVADATGPIPTLDITTPNPATPDVDVPQGPLTIVWNATLAKLMTIYLLRSSGAPIVCVADPLAGTFTIPANFIGGPGEVQMAISGGDLRRLAITQLALAIMTMQIHNYEFTLHVQ